MWTKENFSVGLFKLYTIGSFAMQTQDFDSDIDFVIVSSENIDRYEFLEAFTKILRNSSDWSVYSIPNAFIPLIKCRANSIDIDI